MDTIPPEKLLPLLIVIGVMIWACIGVWTWVGLRKRDDLPVLPVAWRRPVPWRGADLILFFFIYVSSQFLAAGIWSFLPNITLNETARQTELTQAVSAKPESVEIDDSTVEQKQATEALHEQKQHAIILLLRSHDPWIVGFCFFMAVIFAPITEEIIFRMFLQGYLEKIDRLFRCKRRCRSGPPIESQSSFSRILPWGAVPILVTSVFFAMLHFRSSQPTPSTEEVLRGALTFVTGVTLSVIFLLVWLRTVRKARLADFGMVVCKIPKDILVGILAFFAVTPIVFGIQIATENLVPKEIAPDPISIFFLSIAFGTVWCRTHSLVPSIVMHMLFNGLSLTIAILYF